jgi:hypothetical protein
MFEATAVRRVYLFSAPLQTKPAPDAVPGCSGCKYGLVSAETYPLISCPVCEPSYKAFSPSILTRIIEAKRVLAPVSSRPWLDACSRSKRAAIARSRFHVLPPTFKSSPLFVIDVGANHFDVVLGDAAGQITLHVTASSDFASVLRPRDEFLGKHYGKNAASVVLNR